MLTRLCNSCILKVKYHPCNQVNLPGHAARMKGIHMTRTAPDPPGSEANHADRNEILPDGHPQQCSRPCCQLKRRVKVPVSLCGKHHQQLRRGTLLLDGVEADINLLPEDGVFDAIAVEIAARGYRKVKLTHRERMVAAALILNGPGVGLAPGAQGEIVHERLGVPRNIAYRLIDQVKEDGIDVAGVRFYDEPVNIQDTTEAS